MDQKITENNTRAQGFLHYFWYGLATVVGLFVGCLLMVFIFAGAWGLSPATVLRGRTDVTADMSSKITINAKVQSMDDVVAVFKKLEPSVVNIKTRSLTSNGFQTNIEGSVLGSGVIFRDDGYIITNNHVVEGAQEITATIGNEDVPATLVGGDKETDIAVVKVEKKGLPAADLGLSKTLKVGELAVAIGSPFGFEHSVTTGVISGLNRAIQPDTTQGQTYTNLIQTDAAINPGNSGGALANKLGQVIGINTLIYSQSGGSEGLGFAVPIETAKSVANQLINRGSVVHPYIGLVGQTVDTDLAARLHLPVKSGVILLQVTAGSPAEQAGLQKNDIVVSFNGVAIKTLEDLVSFIRDKSIGDKITLQYYHGADIKETTVTLADKPK